MLNRAMNRSTLVAIGSMQLVGGSWEQMDEDFDFAKNELDWCSLYNHVNCNNRWKLTVIKI